MKAYRIQAIGLAALVLLAGCATPNPPITLAERFERVALTNDAGEPLDLWRWGWPIKLGYAGDPAYRDYAMQHAELLASASGVTVEFVESGENMFVRVIPRADLVEEANAAAMELYGRDFGPEGLRGFSCMYSVSGTATQFTAVVGIADDLPDWRVRRCIVQEMTQAIGLPGDLDGRTDTNFTSSGDVVELTAYDRQLLAILYDPRLRSGMTRAEAMPIVRQIVAKMEAEQAAWR